MTDKKQMNSFSSIGYMLKTIWRADKGSVTFSFYKQCTEEVFSAFFVVYYTRVLFTYIQNRNPFSDIVRLSIIFCSIHICIHIASALHAYYIRLRTPKVYRSMFTDVINRAQGMQLSKYEKPEFYNKFSRALDECLTKTMDGLSNFTIGIGKLLSVATSVFLLTQIDPMFILFVIPPIIISLWIGNLINNNHLALNRESTPDARVMDYAKRVFYEKKYAQEIRLYNVKNILFGKHHTSYLNRYKIQKHYFTKIGFEGCVIAFTRIVIMHMGICLYIAYMVKVKHTANIGAYISVLTTAGYITWQGGEMIQKLIEAGKNSVFMNNLKDFLEEKDEAEDEILHTVKKNIEISKTDVLGEINIKNISFTYQGASEPTIKNLSMHVRKGEKIALIGENGAGKTTLIKLLMELYPVTEGSIEVNGININNYNKEEYRARFGTVFQDLQIFSLPLAQNVLLREPINEEERQLVVESLEKAQFGDKLKSLPMGIDTPVTKEFDDKGFVCSGGQAQKIAIARVFAKKPDIVILDEPSSALDPIAEFNMYNNMMQAAEGKTVFFISHRLSSARIADRIFYLENGTVVEEGTHDELMKKNGKYAMMFHLQAKNYREHTYQTKEGDALYEK